MTSASGSKAVVERVVAVDWSGDRSAAGQRKKIWAGVWTTDPWGRICGGKVRLESGRTRSELVDWLVSLARETPRMVVGIDCCFSFPAWFLGEHGCGSVFEFWKSVSDGKGEEWLHRECRMDGSGASLAQPAVGSAPPSFRAKVCSA